MVPKHASAQALMWTKVLLSWIRMRAVDLQWRHPFAEMCKWCCLCIAVGCSVIPTVLVCSGNCPLRPLLAAFQWEWKKSGMRAMQTSWEGQLLHWRGHNVSSMLMRDTNSRVPKSCYWWGLAGEGPQALCSVEGFGENSAVRKIVALSLKGGY